MKTRAGNKKGFLIVDLMVAALIVLIMATAGLDFHVLMWKILREHEDRMKSVYLAQAQIEDLKYIALKDGFFSSPLLGEGPHDNTRKIIVPFGWELDYVVADMGNWSNIVPKPRNDYKKVTVTCIYRKNPKKEAVLIGCVPR